ncbi:MAG TPA: nitrogenase component 1 [Rubrobacter sp.]|nr:nitrogenase component 1 [Rubrobacter sp.]
MTILNESGIPDVLPPLHAVNGLAERLSDVLVVVVGTQAEAHLVQCLPAAPSPNLPPSRRNQRVIFAVLDPDDPPQQGLLASRIVESAAGHRGTELVLLVAGRAAESLGVDAAFEARLVARKLDLPAEVVNPDSPHEVPGILSSDLEDRVLATLVNLCPKRTTSDLVETASPAKRGGLFGSLLGRGTETSDSNGGRPVVLLGGTLSPGSARVLAAELSRTGVEVAGSVPGSGIGELPPLGEGTVVAVMDPNLTSAATVAEKRGATVVKTLMPIGVDGTARFVQDVAEEAGSRTSEVVRARSAWEDLGVLRNRIRGKRIFFTGDTGFEIPLARFLADAGAVVLEVGAPRLDRRFLAAELQALGPDVDVVVSPDYRGQTNRIDESRPDVVISSPGLHLPLVARGHLCRSPRDFLAAGLYGYGGARRILELLVLTMERAETLDSLNL